MASLVPGSGALTSIAPVGGATVPSTTGARSAHVNTALVASDTESDSDLGQAPARTDTAGGQAPARTDTPGADTDAAGSTPVVVEPVTAAPRSQSVWSDAGYSAAGSDQLPSVKRRRKSGPKRKFSRAAVQRLESVYYINTHPDVEEMTALSEQLHESLQRIKTWFGNRRGKASREASRHKARAAAYGAPPQAIVSAAGGVPYSRASSQAGSLQPPAPAKRRRRGGRRGLPQDYLESLFERSHYPSKEEQVAIAASLGVGYIRVRTWFNNRRSKERKISGSARGDPNEDLFDYIGAPGSMASLVVRTMHDGDDGAQQAQAQAQVHAQARAVAGAQVQSRLHTAPGVYRVLDNPVFQVGTKLLSEMTRAVALEKVEDEDECDETGSFRLVRAWLTAGAASFELRWSQERDLYGLHPGALDLWAHDHTRGGVPVPVIQSDAPQSFNYDAAREFCSLVLPELSSTPLPRVVVAAALQCGLALLNKSSTVCTNGVPFKWARGDWSGLGDVVRAEMELRCHEVDLEVETLDVVAVMPERPTGAAAAGAGAGAGAGTAAAGAQVASDSDGSSSGHESDTGAGAGPDDVVMVPKQAPSGVASRSAASDAPSDAASDAAMGAA